eukprot:CAMPEP_0116929712 /NCGR_PEP_ID=MMETSP0467-20121206/26737_1 /TAXON_ID=283647 /ORGANISM="Mesodinium pulex, Strain SPMC105" /LENGTH=94 /DNA_ID=CAMNT_0004609719 /DNA_START=2015 /DNA_END=2297 /DNA_ORIENTATION=-
MVPVDNFSATDFNGHKLLFMDAGSTYWFWCGNDCHKSEYISAIKLIKTYMWEKHKKYEFKIILMLDSKNPASSRTSSRAGRNVNAQPKSPESSW